MKKIAVAVLVFALLMPLAFMPVMAVPKEDSPAWHNVPATDTYHEVTYDQLTALCIAAGLSKNPYPAPIPPTEGFVFPIYSLSASDYYVFTITIGDEVYPGVACNTFDMTVNLMTGEGQMVWQSRHYFGDLGKLNHGFDGVVTADLHGFPGGYFTATWVLQGFGHYTKQTLVLMQDSRISEVATGYCLVLGNRYK